MDWKPLLDPAVPYRGAPLTIAGLESRAADVRARLKGHFDRLKALEAAGAPKAEAPPTFLSVLAAAVGPGDVATALRRWREARAAGAEGALDRLERRVEDAQREVSRVAASIDLLRAEEAQIRAEMAALRAEVEDAVANAALADARREALRAGLHAIELARARATEGAELDADALVLESLAAAREADARLYRTGAARLGGLVEVAGETLACCGRLRAALERVHADGTEMLTDLDRHLARLAAEARAADLGEALAPKMDELRASVGRVHVLAREGTHRLLDRLDRLSESPDLLAPADPERAAAEAEIARLGGT